MSSHIRYNVIFLNNILNVLNITLEPFVEIQWVYAEIRQMMGIEQINTIEIFKIDDTARISIPSYINIPDDAKPAKVLEFLNSATILRPPHFYFGVHEPGESRLAVHLIVDYPRDICISYAAYIVGRLHHTSSIVLSNKVDVSTLRRLIAKDLERKEDLLQLYSAWDGILTNTDDNKLRAATLTRRSNPITGSHNPIRDPPSQNQTSY